MKKCNTCGEEKHLTEFRKKSSSKSGYSGRCKCCQREMDKTFRSNSKESRSQSFKKYYENNGLKWHYRTKYGITLEDFDRMFAEQKGCCAICGVHQDNVTKRFSVDHNHSTGKVRGLLCQNCNAGLGNFMDDISNLKSAIEYLEERGSYGIS